MIIEGARLFPALPLSFLRGEKMFICYIIRMLYAKTNNNLRK